MLMHVMFTNLTSDVYKYIKLKNLEQQYSGGLVVEPTNY